MHTQQGARKGYRQRRLLALSQGGAQSSIKLYCSPFGALACRSVPRLQMYTTRRATRDKHQTLVTQKRQRRTFRRSRARCPGMSSVDTWRREEVWVVTHVYRQSRHSSHVMHVTPCVQNRGILGIVSNIQHHTTVVQQNCGRTTTNPGKRSSIQQEQRVPSRIVWLILKYG